MLLIFVQIILLLYLIESGHTLCTKHACSNRHRHHTSKISRLIAIKRIPSSKIDTQLLSTNIDYENDGPEASRMNKFISDYLKNSLNEINEGSLDNTHDPSSQYYTHLIAIPVDTCHELLLELESIQRAILYHCPILVHACITPAATRLPLLYVHVPVKDFEIGTKILQKLLQESVNETINTLDANIDDGENASSDDKNTVAGVNSDGIRPVTLNFKGLEIDAGSNTNSSNEILSTVGTSDSYGTLLLQKFISQLQQKINMNLGWETMVPPDPQNSNTLANGVIPAKAFRPRIPFMRLPDDWESNHLTQQYKARTSANGNDNDEDSFDIIDDQDFLYMLTADEGGNGISPILWGKWMDDVFGVDIRLREVSIYKRSNGVPGLTETSFYLPDSLPVSLPVGNASLSKAEAHFEEYNEKRWREAEVALRARSNDNREQSISNIKDESDDIMLMKTKRRLESTFDLSVSDEIMEDLNKNSVPESLAVVSNDDNENDNKANDSNELDEWTMQRIKKAVQSRARVKSQLELATKKTKPPIEENNVFVKFKQGTLVPEKTDILPPPVLPTFPSREHCIGFWRVVTSPTGFDVEENDSSRSDNLILRVDGTIAGGPILDQETRQKASGGTWKLILRENEWGEPPTGLVRIRLVIPPKKERILVMEGELEMLYMSMNLPMPSSTFGIPFVEKKLRTALEKDKSELDDILYCKGKVWIEDATTAKGTLSTTTIDSIGTFSLMKLKTPTNPSDFIITIPRPIRNQD